MNPLYKLPLHGVACMPFCDLKNHEVAQQLTINFHPLKDEQFIDIHRKAPMWLMSDKGERYKTEVSLYSNNTEENTEQNEDSNKSYALQVNCQGKGQFHFSKKHVDVYWDSKGTDSAHYFQTIGLALWLELNKILCIHANALAYKNQAIALMAPSRTGKTTLSTFLANNHFKAMTDDMIAIYPPSNGNYNVYPSWPVARVWPETLELISELNNAEVNSELGTDSLQKVHQNFDKKTINLSRANKLGFCQSPKPLSTIYILNRLESNNVNVDSSKCCNITTLSSSKAVMLLLQNSIMGSAYRALNIEADRVKAISTLVSCIKIKQISYLSGKQYLPEIEREILKDLEK